MGNVERLGVPTQELFNCDKDFETWETSWDDLKKGVATTRNERLRDERLIHTMGIPNLTIGNIFINLYI